LTIIVVKFVVKFYALANISQILLLGYFNLGHPVDVFTLVGVFCSIDGWIKMACSGIEVMCCLCSVTCNDMHHAPT